MKSKNIYMSRFGIPVEEKEKTWIKVVVLVVLLVGVIGAISIGIQAIIKNSIEKLAVINSSNSTWVSSLASYWGCIIGGIISGLLTVIGVRWTIRYYHDSDALKSRIEHMPFLLMEIRGYSSFKGDSGTGSESPYQIDSKARSSNDTAEDKLIKLTIGLRNIGHGFANTLVIYTGKNFGGFAYNQLLQVKDCREINFDINTIENACEDEINFGVRYIDCMTNEYIQMYTLQWEGQNLSAAKIDCGYPKFICQTHAIGEL